MRRTEARRGRATPPDPTAERSSGDVPAASAGGSGGDDVRRRDLGRVASEGALKLSGSILSDLLGFVFILIATHGFGAISAGRFFEAMALATILSNIAKLGADTAYVRFVPRFRARGRAGDIRAMLLVGLVPVAALAVVFGAVTYFFGPQLADVLGKGASAKLVPYFRVLALFLPVITVYAIAIAASRGFGSMKPLVVVDNVLVPVSRTALALLAVAAGLGGLALAVITGGTLSLGLAVILLWVYRMLRRVERARKADGVPRTPTRLLFKEFWSFAGPRGFASIFATLSSNINILLLGALFTAPGVAAFAAASRFMKLGTLALVAIFYTIAPQISGLLAEGRRDRAQAVYQVSTWWVMMGSWPVYFVLAVWAPFLMRVFPKGLSSGATALTILSLGMLVSMACGPVSAVLLMGGHAVWNVANTGVALAVNVGLAFLLIPHYHVAGAAIATATAIAVNNLAALVEVGVFMRLGTLGSGFGIVAAASGMCFGALGLVVRFTAGMSLPTFLGFGVVSSLLYLFILRRFSDALELGILWETVVRRKRARPSHEVRHRTEPRDQPRAPARAAAADPARQDELEVGLELHDDSGPT